MDLPAVSSFENYLFRRDQLGRGEVCRQGTLCDHLASVRGDGIWHRRSRGRRTQAHYFSRDFQRRPFHGLAASQRLRPAAFNADTPEMAAVNVARINIALVGGVDDGGLI